MTYIQNVTDSQKDTKTVETSPSESLTIEGLSPQDENNLAVACSTFLEHCQDNGRVDISDEYQQAGKEISDNDFVIQLSRLGQNTPLGLLVFASQS